MTDFHEKMMQRAVVLARRGIGKTSPNPAVGCVIVRDGVIVGEGWHRKAGTPHAEVHALRQAGEKTLGADLYVTLEPCSHHGRTPPCADAVIAAGVRNVYVGMKDPNPLVAGRGINAIRKAGIPVTEGILEDKCRSINLPFIKHITTGLPYVVSKCAMTLDGNTATVSGDSKWITSEASRRYVHSLRGKLDAIIVGVETVLADDPLLDTRLAPRKDPLRVVVDSTLRTPLFARVLADGRSRGTVLATVLPENDPRVSEFRSAGADVICCRQAGGRVDLRDLLVRLGARGVQSLLLEGGGVLAGEMLRQKLIDRFVLFFAPKILGGEGRAPFSGEGPATIAEALKLNSLSVRRFGEDIMISGYPEYACSRD